DNPPDLTSDMFTVMRFTEWVNPQTQNLEWLIRKDGCMHCADPGCLKACPAPGAIVQYSNGIVDFDHEKCIGCGYCVKGCPFNIPRISRTEAQPKAYKCTLCSDRVAVGQGPACAKACPTHAIVFGTKDEMKQHAEERTKDLKSRGFANAGLYDPPGVGGTHVMYVLHHADQPELYAGLPKDPKISPLIEVWKGAGKVAGLAAIAAITSSWAPIGSRARTKREPYAWLRTNRHDRVRCRARRQSSSRQSRDRRSVYNRRSDQSLDHGGEPCAPCAIRPGAVRPK